MKLPVFPSARADCEDGPRPCPWVRCRHHLAIDRISIREARKKVPEPRVRMARCHREELEDMVETCSLDVAERGALERNDVAKILGVNREWIRQIEESAILKLQLALRKDKL